MSGVQIPRFVLDNDCTVEIWVLASKYSCNQAALWQSVLGMETHQSQKAKPLQRKPRWALSFTQFSYATKQNGNYCTLIMKRSLKCIKACIVLPTTFNTRNLQITNGWQLLMITLLWLMVSIPWKMALNWKKSLKAWVFLNFYRENVLYCRKWNAYPKTAIMPHT